LSYGIIGALAAAGSVGYAIYSGEEAKKRQKEALVRQERVQQEARDAAVSQRRAQEEEVRRANRRKPDVAAILEGARVAGSAGSRSTLLTGGQNSTKLLGE